ncbi:tryptophanyl-tRNA synthetase [Paucidesulfovibrio gracilis DSM 16080]|uniref:Tryptophan--tRNA ligase n=1 Tax=Paucidesulfovibrio gracilis DSM 16080 TaxID=1121449 RepID=A0A1T4XFU0_9BACT|nr:tryptophan--tRNA ligase [Paucidesulfovibrio gracilis]SKA88369.1 tryptophanyl-tRNA synthetase [Paucidesulfovibrio gracilis DSM 16080]
MTNTRKRIVSGMRPTGPLHLGHYFGVLVNWVKLQEEFDCFFFVADWHALTSEYADPSRIKDFVPGLVMDWVAAGLDENKCVIYQQSAVKEIAELHLLLSMSTPLGWLERCPTYKEQKQQISQKDLNTYGFLGYPVLMSSDILMYRPEAVPVGQDQLPHLELCREIARRFNHIAGQDFLTEPKDLLTPDAKLPGLDGRKMSKSYGNSIGLGESMETIRPKVMGMLTDENRKRKADPGDPAICNLFPYHKLMTDAETCAEIEAGCRDASWGCVDCKKKLVESMDGFLTPLHDRRRQIENDPERLRAIIESGNAKAREAAVKTMEQVRELIHFNF